MTNTDQNSFIDLIVRAEGLAAFVAILIGVWAWIDEGKYSQPVLMGIAGFICAYFIFREWGNGGFARQTSLNSTPVLSSYVAKVNLETFADRRMEGLRSLQSLIANMKDNASRDDFIAWKIDAKDTLKRHFVDEVIEDFDGATGTDHKLDLNNASDLSAAIKIHREHLQKLFRYSRHDRFQLTVFQEQMAEDSR